MKTTFFLCLLVVCSLSDRHYPKTKDGSEKLIQKWIDGLHKALESKDKMEISKFFREGAVLHTCEGYDSEHRQDDELFDYLVKNGTDANFYLNACVFRGPSYIVALLTVNGLGHDFNGEMYFEINGTDVKFDLGEYLACGWGEVKCRG